MSTTRRAPKHKRDRRRAETEQLRTARRDSLAVLLSRAQRGVLSRDEAALLRAHVEAEIREGDAARQSERGQQRAMDRERRRVEAAEQAIAELERDRAAAEADLADMNRDRDRWWEAAGRAAEQRVEQHRRALADAIAVDPDTTWPQLIQHAEALLEATTDSAPIPYQLTEQAERAVVTDREAIRNALDDPEPVECRHPYHRHEVTRPGPECQ